MAKELEKSESGNGDLRSFPKVSRNENGAFDIAVGSSDTIPALLGMKTPDAANVVFCSALEALGTGVDDAGGMASAMFAELEPRDAIEAMLVVQITTTHVAMTKAAGKMTHQTMTRQRESHERAMVRLGRLFTTQMDALKKYRRKAQQVVRVERVTVNEGGQAIVGDVTASKG
ncbi:hypothetical protein [Shimia sp. SDUM112013]|uniref:hypothetical protein n=1 Tax=Shimia sp. SDUM112013 TaxID=3136160 RepID=UPI0032EAD9C9